MPADPVPDGDPLIQIILLLVLILVNAFFAASEIAVITLNDNKIQKMAEEGHKKAQKILKLTKNSSRFLSTIQIGVTLSGFLTSASASQSFAKKLADVMTFLPFSPSVVEGVATVIITIILSYFSLVLGELVPKKIAMQKSEALAFRFIGVLNATATIFKPFVSFLTVSTNFVLRLLRIDPNASEETVTEEEILMMVDVGEQKGVIQNSAKDMIANIFEFDDTTVTEIMTHRTDMTAVEDTSSISEAVNLSIENGYSRIPVYHEDLDDIVGIVYVKDLLKYVCSQMPEETKLTDVMRGASFIPARPRWLLSWTNTEAPRVLSLWRTWWKPLWETSRMNTTTRRKKSTRLTTTPLLWMAPPPSMKFPTCWASPSPRATTTLFPAWSSSIWATFPSRESIPPSISKTSALPWNRPKTEELTRC